jgi:excisionase family DNA binding protein
MVLNVAEVAALLGRTPGAIHMLVHKQRIPSRKLGGRRVFIPEEIEKWLRKAKAT